MTYDECTQFQMRGLEAISFGLCGTCDECQSAFGMEPREFHSAVEAGEVCDEGRFSRTSCDLCGSTLGGDRFTAHAVGAEDGHWFHLSGCTDCLFAYSNGDGPEHGDCAEWNDRYGNNCHGELKDHPDPDAPGKVLCEAHLADY